MAAGRFIAPARRVILRAGLPVPPAAASFCPCLNPYGRVHLPSRNARGRNRHAHHRGRRRAGGARAPRKRGLPRLRRHAAEDLRRRRPDPARRQGHAPALQGQRLSALQPAARRPAARGHPHPPGHLDAAQARAECRTLGRARGRGGQDSRRAGAVGRLRRAGGRSSRASTRPRSWPASARARSTRCSTATSSTCAGASTCGARFAARWPTR